MFVKVSADSAVSLEDRDNFRAFKVAIDGPPAMIYDARRALQDLAELTDAETAWVSQAALRVRPEVAGDAAWQKNFDAMIDKARPHGWIDDKRQAIKAHIEWKE